MLPAARDEFLTRHKAIVVRVELGEAFLCRSLVGLLLEIFLERELCLAGIETVEARAAVFIGGCLGVCNGLAAALGFLAAFARGLADRREMFRERLDQRLVLRLVVQAHGFGGVV